MKIRSFIIVALAVATSLVVGTSIVIAQKGTSATQKSAKSSGTAQRPRAFARKVQSDDGQAMWLDAQNKQLELQRYKGMVAKANPDATGEAKQIQQHVIDLLNQKDFQAPGREEYYQPDFANSKWKITGWSGKILEMRPSPDGMLVRVKVQPIHSGGNSVTFIHYLVEDYCFSNGDLQYIKTEPPSMPRGTFSD